MFLSITGGLLSGILLAGLYLLSIRWETAALKTMGRSAVLGIFLGGMLLRLSSAGLILFLLARFARGIFHTTAISFTIGFSLLLLRETVIRLIRDDSNRKENLQNT